MTTENNVFNKLFKNSKTELATQKIELGMLQDLDKRKEKFISKNKEIKKLFQQVEKIKSKFKQDFKVLSKENEKLHKDYEVLLDKARDIGADKLFSDAFKSKADVSRRYGEGWDNDILNFFHK